MRTKLSLTLLPHFQLLRLHEHDVVNGSIISQQRFYSFRKKIVNSTE
jgi:hypothetical protein